jgi:hypothetical protein
MLACRNQSDGPRSEKKESAPDSKSQGRSFEQPSPEVCSRLDAINLRVFNLFKIDQTSETKGQLLWTFPVETFVSITDQRQCIPVIHN